MGSCGNTDLFGNNMTVHYSVTGDPANNIGYEQLPKEILYAGTVDNSLIPQRSVFLIRAALRHGATGLHLAWL
jgi:hypothetical protein